MDVKSLPSILLMTQLFFIVFAVIVLSKAIAMKNDMRVFCYWLLVIISVLGIKLIFIFEHKLGSLTARYYECKQLNQVRKFEFEKIDHPIYFNNMLLNPEYNQ